MGHFARLSLSIAGSVTNILMPDAFAETTPSGVVNGRESPGLTSQAETRELEILMQFPSLLRSDARNKRIGYEWLEPRRVLSGVTLITHGFGGSVDDWIAHMADAIANRPGVQLQSPRYRVDVTDPGHDGGPLSVVNTSRSGPVPDAVPDSAEIVILLNWSDVAGSLTFGGGYHRSTRDVAAAVAAQLVVPGFLKDFAFPPAQLPFHLIGHSRGASLVGELARQLGERGVWVDQVTTLDPHPVDGIREPTFFSYDFSDAPMTSWENVVYWDNYWRSDGANSFDFTGEPVANTADLRLSESVLTNSGYSFEHSDVHLWYHGTIDTSAGANDGDAAVPDGPGDREQQSG